MGFFYQDSIDQYRIANKKLDWTSSIFVDYLVERNRHIEDAIRQAGPLLFKIALHHGTYPFPPTEDTLMTYDVFLTFIGMSSYIQHSLFVSVDDISEKHIRTREAPRDRVRLLFQSIISSRSSEIIGTSDDECNEDLLIVLCSVQPRRFSERKYCPKWSRQKLKKVATTLPSSRSTDIGGSVIKDNMCSLIHLLIYHLSHINAKRLDNMEPEQLLAESAGAVMKSLQIEKDVDWAMFSNILVEQMVGTRALSIQGI